MHDNVCGFFIILSTVTQLKCIICRFTSRLKLYSGPHQNNHKLIIILVYSVEKHWLCKRKKGKCFIFYLQLNCCKNIFFHFFFVLPKWQVKNTRICLTRLKINLQNRYKYISLHFFLPVCVFFTKIWNQYWYKNSELEHWKLIQKRI